MVSVIVLNDRQELKKEKIDEWLHGDSPDKTDIGHYRSKNYEYYKSQLNPLAYGTVDLILTGQTASSLFVHKTEDSAFTFGLKDRYNLVGKYGEDIKGLNPTWFLNRQKESYLKKLIKQIKTKYKIA